MTRIHSGSTALLATGNASRSDMEALLREVGFSAVPVNGKQSLSDFTDPVSLCLIDLRENGDALRIARAVRSQHPQAIVIGVADPARPYAAAEAIRAGVFDVLPRPALAGDLQALIANAREQATLAASTGPHRYVESPGVRTGGQFPRDAPGHGAGSARGLRAVRDSDLR